MNTEFDPDSVSVAINDACSRTRAFTAERILALAAVRWVLETADGAFVHVDQRGFASLTDHADQASIFDGRDNEQLKRAFFETLLRKPLKVVLLR